MDKEAIEKFEETMRDFSSVLEDATLCFVRFKNLLEREKELRRQLGFDAEINKFDEINKF